MRATTEHAPNEIVTDPERCGRLCGMLLTSRYAAPLGDIDDRHVYTLDGRVYIVGPKCVEIWDYFTLIDAVRSGVVELDRY